MNARLAKPSMKNVVKMLAEARNEQVKQIDNVYSEVSAIYSATADSAAKLLLLGTLEALEFAGKSPMTKEGESVFGAIERHTSEVSTLLNEALSYLSRLGKLNNGIAAGVVKPLIDTLKEIN